MSKRVNNLMKRLKRSGGPSIKYYEEKVKELETLENNLYNKIKSEVTIFECIDTISGCYENMEFDNLDKDSISEFKEVVKNNCSKYIVDLDKVKGFFNDFNEYIIPMSNTSKVIDESKYNEDDLNKILNLCKRPLFSVHVEETSNIGEEQYHVIFSIKISESLGYKRITTHVHDTIEEMERFNIYEELKDLKKLYNGDMGKISNVINNIGTVKLKIDGFIYYVTSIEPNGDVFIQGSVGAKPGLTRIWDLLRNDIEVVI